MKHPEKTFKHKPPGDQPLMWRVAYLQQMYKTSETSFLSPWLMFKLSTNKPPGYTYTAYYQLTALNEFRGDKPITKERDESF
jgi:hypothetical protein